MPQPATIAASTHNRLRPNETLAIVTARANLSPIPAKRPNLIRSNLPFMARITDSSESTFEDGPGHRLP
jgi:hypothetical protein